jgi:hypothetical protein
MSNHIIDLEYLSKQNNQEAVLDVLFEHACELGIDCLVMAIESYWESKANNLTNKEYSEAQAQSIKEQFGDD